MFSINEFWKDVLNQDREAIRAWFCPDAVINWHCTNESFNVDEFVIANCEYPGEWDGRVERTEQVGNTVISAANVYTKDKSLKFYAVSFITLREGKIAEVNEYWGDCGEAPLWRQEKCIGRKIK